MHGYSRTELIAGIWRFISIAAFLCGTLAIASACGSASAADAQSCRADCECPSYCCNRGTCVVCARLPVGLCGPGRQGDQECACNGGVCDERGCCLLDDGGIGLVAEPVCTFDDAGVGP